MSEEEKQNPQAATWNVRYCAITQQGRRPSHQDALVADGIVAVQAGTRLYAKQDVPASGSLLFAVVDGMGGQAGGESAAAIVATDLARPAPEQVASALTEHLEAISDRVGQAGIAWKMPHMGATVALIVVQQGGVIVANVGDCRCYQVADGYLGQLSLDDHDPAFSKNVVTQSLGGDPRVIDPHEFEVSHGNTPPTRYFLCSDGVHAYVDPEVIRDVLQTSDSPKDAVIQLDRLAGDVSRDNYSVLVIDVYSAGSDIYQQKSEI